MIGKRKETVSIVLCTIMVMTVLLGALPSAAADGGVAPMHEPNHSSMFPQIDYHHVNVTINERFAHTVVDQAFTNVDEVPLHGQYFFPVPENAVLTNFAVEVDGAVQYPEMVTDEEANSFLKSQVLEQGDSSFLSYLDYDLFLLDIYIEPNQTKVMHLEYDELLSKDNNAIEYFYTLSTETYSATPVPDIRIYVDITSTKGVHNIYVPEYDASISRHSRNHVVVFWESVIGNTATRGGTRMVSQGTSSGSSPEDASPDDIIQKPVHYREFSLFYTPVEDDTGASLLNFDDGADRFFMFLYSKETEEESQRLPKDVVFVFDKSGSMGGEKIEKTREALIQMIGLLAPDDRFDLITFDSTVNTLFGELATASPANVQTGLKAAQALTAGGSTALHGGLMQGFDEIQAVDNTGRSQLVMFLTDGLANVGVSDNNEIINDVAVKNSEHRTPMFVFGVGTNVNNHLLGQLAVENWGEVHYIDQSGVDLSEIVVRVFTNNANPVLTDVNVEFEGVTTSLVYPKTIGRLYEGSELILVGKYQGGPDVIVHVSGTSRNGTVHDSFQFQIGPNEDYPFIARLWATRRIGDLLFNISATGGGTQEQVDEVIELSLKYGIVTPFTYMIIQENANEATQNNSDYGYEQGTGQGTGSASGSAGSSDGGDAGQGAQAQGQSYKSTKTSSAALGGNARTVGTRSFVELFGVLFELTVISEENITRIVIYENDTIDDWIRTNITVNRIVAFGSEEYFDLVEKHSDVLALGNLIVFEVGDEVIYVTDGSNGFFLMDRWVDADGFNADVNYRFSEPATLTLHYRMGLDGDWTEMASTPEKTLHSFRLENLDEGIYQYYAKAVYQGSEVSLGAEADCGTWTISPEPVDDLFHVVIGPVLDQDGEPVVGNHITVTGNAEAKGTLDDTGSLALELPAGTFIATLLLENGDHIKWTFTVSDTGEFDGDIPIVFIEKEPPHLEPPQELPQEDPEEEEPREDPEEEDPREKEQAMQPEKYPEEPVIPPDEEAPVTAPEPEIEETTKEELESITTPPIDGGKTVEEELEPGTGPDTKTTGSSEERVNYIWYLLPGIIFLWVIIGYLALRYRRPGSKPDFLRKLRKN